MLAVGLITGQLTAGLRPRPRRLHREERAAALYELARICRRGSARPGARISDESIERPSMPRRASSSDPAAARPGVREHRPRLDIDLGIAQWRSTRAVRQAPAPTRCPGAKRCTFRPRSGAGARVLALRARNRRLLKIPSSGNSWIRSRPHRHCLERVHYVGIAQDALCAWSRSGCATPCWRRCRMTCELRSPCWSAWPSR